MMFFSNFTWCIPLKNKNAPTITDEFSRILTNSRPKHNNIDSDPGIEIINTVFQILLETNNIHHYTRLTDEGPSISERFSRTLRNFLKNQVFHAGKSDWFCEIPTVIKK